MDIHERTMAIGQNRHSYRRIIVIGISVLCLAGLAVAYKAFAPQKTVQVPAGQVIQAVGDMVTLRIDGTDTRSTADDSIRRFIITNTTAVRDVSNGPAVAADKGLLQRIGTRVVIVSSSPSSVPGIEEILSADVIYTSPSSGLSDSRP